MMVGEKMLERSRTYYSRKCKRERSTTNIESLPDELLLEILVLLPADDLHHRTRVVCRRWGHLIHSVNFIKTHLHRSPYGLFFSLIDRPTFATATQGEIETSAVSDEYPIYSRIQSSCNGLSLHYFDGQSVSIINPVTGQQFDLPSLSNKKTIKVGCGIGYAADSMVYKVAQPYIAVGDQVCLGIVSVGSDNFWRHVGVEHLPVNARNHLLEFPLISEGFITWPKRYKGSYLTLDVETEILTLHPSPVPQDFQTYSVYLSTGISLSLLVIHDEYVIELWEMKAESGEWRQVVGDIKLGARKHWLQENGLPGFGKLLPLGWVRYPEFLALYFKRLIASCFIFNLNTKEIYSVNMTTRCHHNSAHVHKQTLTWFT